MPRRKEPPKPERRSHGQGSAVWVARRKRWRARLPKVPGQKVKESWHLTRDEAEAWLARELIRDPESFDPLRPLGEYLTYWRGLMDNRWSELTRIRYKYEAAASRAIHGTALYRLRGDQVQAIQAALLKRGLTRRYVYNVVSLLKRALADAVKWKILPENVVETVTLPDPEKTRMPAWDLDETRAVLSKIVGHRFEAVYLLILWGGLRIGEVVGLRWDQIQDDGTVAFDLAEHTQARGRPLGRTKRERDRETEIPPHVVTRLCELRKDGPVPMEWKGGRPMARVAYVYVSQRPDGNRWTPRKIRDDWNALVATVKTDDGTPVKLLTPHGGRHTFGTMHMVSGTPLADLSTMMGHASPAVTAGVYLDSSKKRRRAAAKGLADLIGTDDGTNKGQIEGQADV